MGRTPMQGRRWCAAAMLVALLLAGTPIAMAGPQPVASLIPPNPDATPNSLPFYLVRPAEPNVMVFAEAREGLAPLAVEDQQKQREELGSELARLRAAGLAGAYSFDEARAAYRAELSEAAVSELRAHRLVADVERDLGADAPWPEQLAASQPHAPTTSGVSSVIFAQVNSPLVWGNTNIPGLSVQLTLEDGAGNPKGVPSGAVNPANTCQALPNCVKVDDNTLYFETTFVDPNNRQQYVSMLPGDSVHVITTGDDPGTPGPDDPEDKRVPIVSIDACSSPEQDKVEGTTLPNARVIVTFGSLALRSGYLTPGSGMTYSEQTTDDSGHFVASTFRTTTDPTLRQVSFVQGSKGFARVQVPGTSGPPSGDEVWTIWGQNAYILENSPVMHGYAYPIPPTPSGFPFGASAHWSATTGYRRNTSGTSHGRGGHTGLMDSSR